MFNYSYGDICGGAIRCVESVLCFVNDKVILCVYVPTDIEDRKIISVNLGLEEYLSISFWCCDKNENKV